MKIVNETDMETLLTMYVVACIAAVEQDERMQTMVNNSNWLQIVTN